MFYSMPQISSRYVLLYEYVPPNLGQMVMAGEEGNSSDSLRLTFVNWGLSMYLVVQLIVCQITNPRQNPFTKYSKIVRKIGLIVFWLCSSIFGTLLENETSFLFAMENVGNF